MIDTVYIQGTKKAANETLKSGKDIECRKYDIRGMDIVNFKSLKDGTVVKFYKQIIQGNPYAVSYGSKKGDTIK